MVPSVKASTAEEFTRAPTLSFPKEALPVQRQSETRLTGEGGDGHFTIERVGAVVSGLEELERAK